MNEKAIFSFEQVVDAVRKVADDQVDDCGYYAAIDVGCVLLGVSSERMTDLLNKQAKE